MDKKTDVPTDAPATLVDAIRYFSDPDRALAFMVELRWPNGVTCPTCGSQSVSFVKTRRVWACRGQHPRKQFSVKIGTTFEDSPIGLDKWFAAMWLIGNAKNGISSYEIARGLHVTQKTAWFMLHRIRLAMQRGTFDKLSGDVEAASVAKRASCTRTSAPRRSPAQAARTRAPSWGSWNGTDRTATVA